MIPLDVFKEIFPEFKEYYNELLMLRYKKKELVRMYDVYREALRAADEGTVQLMIEEQQKEIEEQHKEIEKLQKELERMSALLEKEIRLSSIESVNQGQSRFGDKNRFLPLFFLSNVL